LTSEHKNVYMLHPKTRIVLSHFRWRPFILISPRFWPDSVTDSAGLGCFQLTLFNWLITVVECY